jgi:hypothetical protein
MVEVVCGRYKTRLTFSALDTGTAGASCNNAGRPVQDRVTAKWTQANCRQSLGLVEDGLALWTQSVYRVAPLQVAQQNGYFISEAFHFVILTSPRRMYRARRA